ncbi:MAG: hypothetical protein JAY73_17610, partial [Candidatus Thiodiazotropha taylori]|nr:hypothetical protein [Candidatus Thiodiazotropha taylori]
AMLGIINIKNKKGDDVDYEVIQRWIVENSKLPDFSFWQTRVERGTLCAVAVSGYEQGLLAGDMARKILQDRVSPADLPTIPSSEGQPMISLARARSLGLKPDVDLLLNTKAITGYIWEH